MLKTMLTHPFAVLIYCLIIGSFFIFDNAKVADDTIPSIFNGNWSIIAGVVVYVIGVLYLVYSIRNSKR